MSTQKNGAARAQFRRINNAAIVNSALIFQNAGAIFLNLIQKHPGGFASSPPANATKPLFILLRSLGLLNWRLWCRPTQRNKIELIVALAYLTLFSSFLLC